MCQRMWTSIASFLSAFLLVVGISSAQSEAVDGFVVDSVSIVGGELEELDALVAPLIDSMFTDSTSRILIEFLDLDDDEYLDDEEIELAFYAGLDQDEVTEDDFDGDDTFDVDPASLTADGQPLALFTPGDLVDGAFTAGPASLDLTELNLDDFDLEDLDLGGFDLGDFDPADLDLDEILVLDDVVLSGIVEDEGASLVTDPIEGAIPAELFESIEAPFPASLFFDTVYEWITDDGLLGLGLVEDVDLDDDGVDDAFSIEIEISAVSCQIAHPELGVFRRGDVDGNGTCSALLDALALLEWGFVDGEDPPCLAASDVDDSGSVSPLLDAFFLLDWGFAGGDEPPAPGPDTCGADPDGDDLSCETEPDCVDA